MSNIPQSRLILYIMIAGLLPIFFAIFNFVTHMNAVEQLEQRMLYVEQLAFTREKKQSLNMIVKDNYKSADHFYIDKHLETLSFLSPEIETLHKLVNNKYFAGDESVKSRLEFLTGPGNSFLFSEGNVLAYPFFQETIASLVHPVEINLDDLKKILALVEGQQIGPNAPAQKRPQLTIIDFKLDKKEATPNNEVFLLNLKLLKREYS